MVIFWKMLPFHYQFNIFYMYIDVVEMCESNK